MGLLDFLIPARLRGSQPVNPAIPYAPQLTNQLLKGVPTWQGFNAESLVVDGYAGNDIVYSIVKLIQDKAMVPEWAVYKEVDTVKAKRYKSLIKNPAEIGNWNEVMKLKEEAYELYTGDTRLNELLKYPNAEDTWSDLVGQEVMYKLVTGNAFVYAKLIEIGVNKGKPFMLYALPSQYMSIIVDIEAFPAEKIGYQLYFGKEVAFMKEDIMQDKYANPNWSVTGAELYGLSPLKAAAKVLTRNNQSNTAIVSAYANEAPIGIISPKMGQSFDPKASGDSMKALKSEIANKSGANKRGLLPITSYEMTFTPIGFTPEDMNFINSQKWDKEQLCSVFHVPPPLLGSSDGAIYNNMKMMRAQLLTDAVLPALNSFRDNFNRMISSYWGYAGTGLCIDYDPKCFPELEANRKEQAEWTDMVPMSIEQRYEIMGLNIDDVPEDMRSMLLYKGQPIDSLQNITPPTL